MSNAHDRYLAALPEDWPRRELGQICTQIVSGGTPSRSNSACWGGSIPWVTPGELTNLRTKYLSSTDERITDLGLASSGATLVPSDSLLVTTRATLGSVALAAMPLATNQGFKTAMFGPDVDASFGYHLFHRLKPELTRRSSGTTFLEISGSQFKQIVVPVPPSPEQRRIAEILDTVDEAIRSTETLIAKLEQMKQGLLHDLLTRGIDENGELRDSERHPEQFMVSKLGLVPKQWRVLSLQEASASIPGSTTIGPFGSNLVASDYRTSGVPVVFVRDIRADGFKWISDVYVSVDKAAQLAAHVTLPGDILATKMGLPPCIAALHPDDARPAVITADVIRLRPDIDVVDAGWLVASINSETVRKQVRAITGGVTRPKVTLRDFRQILIAVPPITEQIAIRDVLTWEDLLRQQADAQLSKVRLLKRGLMEDLLIGRVRVTVDDEEAK
jgi:type I restriction enzyme S subunit